MERCSVLVEDGEGWRRIPQPCSFGKSGSPEASGDEGGRLSRYKKRKITHFFTLFFRNLQEIKKIKNISFSILLCFMSTI